MYIEYYKLLLLKENNIYIYNIFEINYNYLYNNNVI
jgi:hypothetical protein